MSAVLPDLKVLLSSASVRLSVVNELPKEGVTAANAVVLLFPLLNPSASSSSEAAPIKCDGRESDGRPTYSQIESAGRPTDSFNESVDKPADSLPSHFIGAERRRRRRG